jgi:GNAT superfamily N-acetyltransferase
VTAFQFHEALSRAFALVLRADHLPQALELSRALNWPYRLEDWEFAFNLGRGLAVEIDGGLAGTALWWPYGDRHASAGMIIVSGQYQRMGIGRALMDALLADAAGRTIILNSTDEGLDLYKGLGFVAHGHVHQHQAILGRPDRAGRTRGYGCVRTWGRGVVIGPVVAADIADARALIAALAASHAGQFVRIDVPQVTGLSPWLEAIGLPRVGKVVSMALGTLPALDHRAQLFALSNQSLG